MKYLAIFSLVLLSGCAFNSTTKTESLSAKFAEYKPYYNTSSESSFFSEELWKTLQKARLPENKNKIVAPIGKFPNELNGNIAYMESIDQDKGCLFVSGNRSDGTPMDYHLTYTIIGGVWTISGLAVDYYFDGTERFLTEAICDTEKQQQLWVEWMKKKGLIED